MAQFLALGLEIPEDNPDRNRYLSMTPRTRKTESSAVAEINLMSPGDILFLNTRTGFTLFADMSQPSPVPARLLRRHQSQVAANLFATMKPLWSHDDQHERQCGQWPLRDVSSTAVPRDISLLHSRLIVSARRSSDSTVQQLQQISPSPTCPCANRNDSSCSRPAPATISSCSAALR